MRYRRSVESTGASWREMDAQVGGITTAGDGKVA